MKAFAQSKLPKKLLLLFVLTGALTYLRQPDRAQAWTCDDGCISVWSECKARCNGNQSCINTCTAQEQECFKECDGQ